MGRLRVWDQTEGGHLGPPLEKINYLYCLGLVLNAPGAAARDAVIALVKHSFPLMVFKSPFFQGGLRKEFR